MSYRVVSGADRKSRSGNKRAVAGLSYLEDWVGNSVLSFWCVVRLLVWSSAPRYCIVLFGASALPPLSRNAARLRMLDV